MATAESWWVVVPPNEHGASTRPADAIIVSTQNGSANYNTLLKTDTGTITANGKQYTRFMGPFTTEQDAQTSQPGSISAVDLVGLGIAGALFGAGGQAANASGDIQAGAQVANVIDAANPLNYLKPIAGFFNALTQANTWQRVAEIGAGAMILYLGLKHTFEGTGVATATRAGTSTAKKGAGHAKTIAEWAALLIPK